jgi:AAA domain
MRLIALTGASGSGKTAIAKAIAARGRESTEVLFFDSIGIPPLEQMTAEHGSPEQWQRAKTIEWMARIAATLPHRRNVLFEGHTRLSFLQEAVAGASIGDYHIILIDCDDGTRLRRLTVDRKQPELANPKMMAWARFLRQEAERTGSEIVDTSHDPLDACVARICQYLA